MAEMTEDEYFEFRAAEAAEEAELMADTWQAQVDAMARWGDPSFQPEWPEMAENSREPECD